MATVTIKTFTCTYNTREDRLLLTMNYQEIDERVDFWLTRSFLLKLLPVFFDLTTHVQDELIPQKSLRNETQQKQSTDTSIYVLTQKVPLLLESIDFHKLSDNQHKIVFKNLESTTYAEAFLEQANLDGFVQLLLNAAPRYEWGIYNI